MSPVAQTTWEHHSFKIENMLKLEKIQEMFDFSNIQMLISPQPLEIINQNHLHLDRIDLSLILEPFLADLGASEMLII